MNDVRNDYGAAYGRLAERVQVINLEWNWQPNPRALAYAHYGWERMRNRMAQISDDPAGWASGDPNAGGAAYPLANRWDEHGVPSPPIQVIWFLPMHEVRELRISSTSVVSLRLVE